MRKIANTLLIVAVALFMTGCQSNKNSTMDKSEKSAQKAVIGAEGIERPDWVIMGRDTADGIYAVGAGKMTTLQTSLKLAKANGRIELARQLNVEVQSALTTYQQDSGVDDQSQVINFMEEASVQKTDAWLQGTKQVDYWLGADGTAYVLMFLPYDLIVPTVNQALVDFTRNPSAKFAEEKALDALKRYGLNKDGEAVEKGSAEDVTTLK